MSIIISERLVKKSRKSFKCNACEQILSFGSIEEVIEEFGLTEEEALILEKQRERGFNIFIGESYLRQVGVYEGDFGTWKCIPEVHKICLKYGLYDEG